MEGGEALLTNFKVPSWHIPGETEEKQQKSQSG
jgi:hypothetical protein